LNPHGDRGRGLRRSFHAIRYPPVGHGPSCVPQASMSSR
jgi:hypothetical protein